MLKKYQNDFLIFIWFQLKKIFKWKLSFLCIIICPEMQEEERVREKRKFQKL